MKAKITLKGVIKAILIGIIIGFIMRLFFIQALYISTSSMNDTLLIGDYVLIEKFSYILTEPKRGDIVALKLSKEEFNQDFGILKRIYYRFRGYFLPQSGVYVKRVIGLPGEEFEIRSGFLYINDRLIPRYKFSNINVERITIPNDSYFLLGDNILNSKDSREWGEINKKEIIGRVFLIYWSVAPRVCIKKACGGELEQIDREVALRNTPQYQNKSEKYYICKICGNIYRDYFDVKVHPRFKFWGGLRLNRCFNIVK
ncbi:MAG: signal peptidase I [bacterium]